jgi:hypothetical protein
MPTTFEVTLKLFYTRSPVSAEKAAETAAVPDLTEDKFDAFITSYNIAEDFLAEFGAGGFGTIISYEYKPVKHELVFKVVPEPEDELLYVKYEGDDEATAEEIRQALLDLPLDESLYENDVALYTVRHAVDLYGEDVVDYRGGETIEYVEIGTIDYREEDCVKVRVV